ncbi:MAG: polysaccharide biosynthesis protein, partial [Lachnospiraceae bacterium]|nr:polysaccharide biosynthesis protein [Lachnospiraceae bacterium]
MKKEKKPFNVKLLYRRTALMVYDIISIVVASYLALLIRYDMHVRLIPDYFLEPIERFLPLNIIITMVLFYIFRLYSSLWAFAGEAELQNLVMASFLSGVCSAIGLQFFKADIQPVPKSYYFIYTFILISMVFVSRFSYRFFRGLKHKRNNKDNNISVMIIGAGEAANVIIKETINSNFSTMKIKCIID